MYNLIKTKTQGFLGKLTVMWTMLGLFCTKAYAVLPNADDILPDAVVNNNNQEKPIDMLLDIGTYILQGVIVILAAIVVYGSSMKIYEAFSEAKDKKGGWGTFGITAVVGVVVIVVFVALAVMAVSWL